jgi:PTH1 family peptidyl-tRNA hydrolase
MNLSGFSVQTAVDYYKLPLQNLLILCDDVDIPFGEIRIRAEGGTGGHNGLKHIEQQLASPFYSRLRLGVGKDPSRDLADYVLERFSSREIDEMQPFLDRGIEVVKTWARQGVPVASQKAGQLNHDYKLKGVNPDENNRSSSL